MSIRLKSYFLDHLKKLKIKKGDNLLIYSDLSRFGLQKANLPKIVLSCLKLTVGKYGSIVMPFYNFGTKSNFIFNKNKFIHTSMISALSKEFSKEKSIIRSNCLIHNHIGCGPNAKILNYSDEKMSIGKNTDFEFLKNFNFKLLMLACDPMQGATYLHHLEAILGVPYRKWILLKRKKIYQGIKKVVFIKYYARRNEKFESDFNSFFNKIKKYKSVLSEQKVKYGRSYLISLKDLDRIGLKFLKKNKYCFVKKK